MTAQLTLDWVSHLASICAGINNTRRNVLFGYTSIEAQKPAVVEILKKKFALKRYLYAEKFENKPTDLKIGQRVKIYKKKGVFSRGYEANTEKEPAFIRKILDTHPRTFLLTGHKKPYYKQQLIRYPISLDSNKGPDYGYTITDEKIVPESTLRSRKILKNEKKYRIQNRSLDFDEWMSDEQRQKLVNHGVLSPFSK